MRIGPAANFARLNVAEEVTALWSFAHANGLLTDDINERTVGAGVTVDGARLLDGALNNVDMALAATLFLRSGVSGDAFARFIQQANGLHEWGPGAAARDTSLSRAGVAELATNGDFNVGGALDLAGDIETARRAVSGIVVDQDDFDTGVVTVQRLSAGAAVNITGFAGGRDGRVIIVLNIGVFVITLTNNDVSSAAANRLRLPNAANVVLSPQDGATLWYDSVSLFWRMAGAAI